MKPGDYVVIKPNVTDQPQVVGLVGVVVGLKAAQTKANQGYYGVFDAHVEVPYANDSWLFLTKELRPATQADILAAKLQGLL